MREEKHRVEAKLNGRDKFDPETMEDEHMDESANTVSASSLAPDVAQPHREEVAHVAHAQAHDVSHSEPVSCPTCTYEYLSKPVNHSAFINFELCLKPIKHSAFVYKL